MANRTVVLLTIGLITEAIIFVIFAFDVPKKESSTMGKCLSIIRR